MKQRLNPYVVAPDLTQQLIDFAKRVAQAGLEPSLAELVKIRASQINGCAICLHMHTRDARKSGETEERIFMLDAWQESPHAAAVFDPLRPRLIRVAYRMLGSLADSEDVVQDAFIRWLGTDRGAVQEPEAFLRRVVTRLCLDFLKSARNQRETYVGTWLPEPIVETAEEDADDVTLPLMLVLERLQLVIRLPQTTGLQIDDGKVVAIYVMRNPDKLQRVGATAH